MFDYSSNAKERMTQVGANKVACGSPLEAQRLYQQSGRTRKPRLLEQLHQALRSRHYSRRTEQTYCQWVKRFGPRYQSGRFPGFWHAGYDWPPDQCHGGGGMIALQSMLMQCTNKKIVLLPAWPKEWDVDFKLHAPYRTVVEGSVKNGKLVNVEVSPETRGKDVIVMEPQ